MRKLFNHPYISVASKFGAQLLLFTMWGLVLSPVNLETKAPFMAIVAVLTGIFSVAFFSWDRKPVTLARIGLYGLLVGGEAMVAGSCVLAFLGAFTGSLEPMAMILCGLSGFLIHWYALTVLYRDNMPEAPGSNDTKDL